MANFRLTLDINIPDFDRLGLDRHQVAATFLTHAALQAEQEWEGSKLHIQPVDADKEQTVGSWAIEMTGE